MVGIMVRRCRIGRALSVTVLALPVLVGVVLILDAFFSGSLTGAELWVGDMLRDWLMVPPRVSELLSILIVDTGISLLLLEGLAGVAAIVSCFGGASKRTTSKKARQASSRQASKKPRASSRPARKPVGQGRKAK